MKNVDKVRKRLTQLTELLLSETSVDVEIFKAYQEELKALRELIATWKALEAFDEAYGEEDEPSDKPKRESTTAWD